MRYLTEDLADPKPPAKQALRDSYSAAPKRFEIPARVTFEQVYFSSEARGAEADAEAALEAREAARLPPFEEVRDEVAKAYATDARTRHNATAYARMRTHYHVLIEWPKGIDR